MTIPEIVAYLEDIANELENGCPDFTKNRKGKNRFGLLINHEALNDLIKIEILTVIEDILTKIQEQSIDNEKSTT